MEELSQQSLQGLAACVVSHAAELVPSTQRELHSYGLVDEYGRATPKGVNLIVTLAVNSAVLPDSHKVVDPENIAVDFEHLGCKYRIPLVDIISFVDESTATNVEQQLQEGCLTSEEVTSVLRSIDWEVLWSSATNLGEHPSRARDLWSSSDSFDLYTTLVPINGDDKPATPRQSDDEIVAGFDEIAFVSDLEERISRIDTADAPDIDPSLIDWAGKKCVQMVSNEEYELVRLPRVVVRVAGKTLRRKSEVFSAAVAMLEDFRNNEDLTVVSKHYDDKYELALVDTAEAMTRKEVLSMLSQENDNVQDAKSTRDYDTMAAVTSI